MKEFPTTAEEFYELRDDRTNRCGSGHQYQSASSVIYLSRGSSDQATAQVMLLVSANLLSRWCRKVTIVMPHVEASSLLYVGTGNLGDIVLAQMRDADPFGDFQMATGDIDADIRLYIGYGVDERFERPGIFIGASGWLASISARPTSLPQGNEDNLLGAVAAACFGVSQMFKVAAGVAPEHHIVDGIFDLYRISWAEEAKQAFWPKHRDVGSLLMVGAGSVGSAAAYCMRLANLSGDITIIDGDVVKVENFNRSPIFGRETYGVPKAQATSAFLNESSLISSFDTIWWDEFLQRRGRLSLGYDIWLPLANDFGVRRAMQSNVPPLMIHASTSKNWGVNHGRHIPGRDDCLADRFVEEVTSGDLTCGIGPIEMSNDQAVDAALPFTSLFGGLLITADLVRTQLEGYPQVPNFALFDWYGSLKMIQAWDHKPREGCVCRDQGASLHDKFNGPTKYRSIFHFA